MEGINKETQEQIERKKEFHRIVDKIRNLQKPNETGQGTSRHQTGETQPDPETPEFEDAETMSSGSENTIAVPVINFKRYLGATSVRYINMGKASKVQTNMDWDLEETIHQVEQNFATDLKTIAGEKTDDEKLLKTLVCIEIKTIELIPEKNKGYTKHLSRRFGVVFYDDKKINPASIEKNNSHPTPLRTPGNQQNVRCSQAILVAETNKGDTKQMRRIFPVQNGR